MFRQDVEDLQKRQRKSLQFYHRTNHIRCFDCITDFFEEMISDVLTTMLEIGEEFYPCNAYLQVYFKTRSSIISIDFFQHMIQMNLQILLIAQRKFHLRRE